MTAGPSLAAKPKFMDKLFGFRKQAAPAAPRGLQRPSAVARPQSVYKSNDQYIAELLQKAEQKPTAEFAAKNPLLGRGVNPTPPQPTQRSADEKAAQVADWMAATKDDNLGSSKIAAETTSTNRQVSANQPLSSTDSVYGSSTKNADTTAATPPQVTIEQAPSTPPEYQGVNVPGMPDDAKLLWIKDRAAGQPQSEVQVKDMRLSTQTMKGDSNLVTAATPQPQVSNVTPPVTTPAPPAKPVPTANTVASIYETGQSTGTNPATAAVAMQAVTQNGTASSTTQLAANTIPVNNMNNFGTQPMYQGQQQVIGQNFVQPYNHTQNVINGIPVVQNQTILPNQAIVPTQTPVPGLSNGQGLTFPNNQPIGNVGINNIQNGVSVQSQQLISTTLGNAPLNNMGTPRTTVTKGGVIVREYPSIGNGNTSQLATNHGMMGNGYNQIATTPMTNTYAAGIPANGMVNGPTNDSRVVSGQIVNGVLVNGQLANGQVINARPDLVESPAAIQTIRSPVEEQSGQSQDYTAGDQPLKSAMIPSNNTFNGTVAHEGQLDGRTQVTSVQDRVVGSATSYGNADNGSGTTQSIVGTEVGQQTIMQPNGEQVSTDGYGADYDLTNLEVSAESEEAFVSQLEAKIQAEVRAIEAKELGPRRTRVGSNRISTTPRATSARERVATTGKSTRPTLVNRQTPADEVAASHSSPGIGYQAKSSVERGNEVAFGHVQQAMYLLESSPEDAEQELMSALQAVAKSRDDATGTRIHTKSLHDAVTALWEADELHEAYTNHGEEYALEVASEFTTMVGKSVSRKMVDLDSSLRTYHNYARQALIIAIGQNPAGSEALYGMGRLFQIAARENPVAAEIENAKSKSFFLTSAAVNTRNWKTTNELGVMFAREGKLVQATNALKRSILAKPTTEAWQNLATIYNKQNNVELASLAETKAYELSDGISPGTTDATQIASYRDSRPTRSLFSLDRKPGTIPPKAEPMMMEPTLAEPMMANSPVPQTVLSESSIADGRTHQTTIVESTEIPAQAKRLLNATPPTGPRPMATAAKPKPSKKSFTETITSMFRAKGGVTRTANGKAHSSLR